MYKVVESMLIAMLRSEISETISDPAPGILVFEFMKKNKNRKRIDGSL